MSYFGAVQLGEKIGETIENLEGPRSGFLVEAGTYVGIAPEITAVLYAPDDKFGLLSAMASLVPMFLCAAHLSVFLCRRTAEDLWIGVGQIVCEILNGIVKIIIRQPRPSSPVTNMPADSYGMPSAHAQYMGYFCAVSIYQSLGARHISWQHKLVRVVAATLLAWITAYSRYYLYYHSGSQVIVGYLLGTFLGIAWPKLFEHVRRSGLLNWGLSLWPCRLMLVKDASYSVANEYDAYLREKGKKIN